MVQSIAYLGFGIVVTDFHCLPWVDFNKSLSSASLSMSNWWQQQTITDIRSVCPVQQHLIAPYGKVEGVLLAVPGTVTEVNYYFKLNAKDLALDERLGILSLQTFLEYYTFLKDYGLYGPEPAWIIAVHLQL